MKSWKTPTAEQVKKAISLLGHVEQYRYFFNRLENPEWILPLKEKEYFSIPPKPSPDEERGTIGFPPWPESQYLARMASLKPDIVLDVILKIPDNENILVYEDLTDAALNMPANFAARLIEKAKIWARSSCYFLLPVKLGALIAHLAKGNQLDDALDLANILLDVMPDPNADAESKAKAALKHIPEPIARFPTWDYEEILNKYFPELIKTARIRALELLCNLLEKDIRLSRMRGDDQEPEDYSYSWRPAIEEHQQNIRYGVKDALVSAIRDAVESMALTDSFLVPEIVSVLEARNWKIFHRIALHLMRLFPDAASDLLAGYLTNKVLFEDLNMRHEYALLIRENFCRLTAEQQRLVLEWIENGPDLQKLFKDKEEGTGEQPSEEYLSQYRKKWQLTRLDWIKGAIPKIWKQYYESLVAEFGAPEHTEFNSYSASWVGPTSPKSTTELQEMSVSDIVQFLKSWTPPNEHWAPSPEGLARILASAVCENPVRFAIEAARFKELDPTYIRALITGFRDALRKKNTFEWPAVLELCQWAVIQPRQIARAKHEIIMDYDQDWGTARKSIADLLSAGFEKGPGAISIIQRTTVWEILRPLTDDPDPTPEDENKYGGSNMDPPTLSINTTRGEAFHSIIRYALWIRRHFEKLPNVDELIGKGFDVIPEVRDALDKHLDLSKDPSLAIRAVYGQWLPWLLQLDAKWTRERIPVIFPINETLRKLYATAWETYLIFNRPYNEVLEILRVQYMLAVERLGLKKEASVRRDPDQRLVEHLMEYYWRGKLDLDNPQDILAQFWDKANAELCSHALEFIGKSLHNTKETIPPEILDRVKYLWNRRLEIAKSTDAPDRYLAEMTAFGWWFISGKFDDRWAIEQLFESLKIAGKTKPDRLVVEKLAELVPDMPKETISCLELIIKGDKKGWSIYGWRENAKLILAKTLQTAVSSEAENLIHYLGRHGYLEFGALLKKE